MTAPQIYGYLDFREFLSAWLRHRKELDPTYSYRTFADAAGLSRSALPNILSGSRSPRTSTLDAMARALGLSPPERNYLDLLVEFDRAPTVSARRAVMARLTHRVVHRRSAWIEDDPDAFVQFASRWAHVAIRELARHPSFRPDPAWIAATLVPSITAQEAKEALDELEAMGQIVPRDDRVEVPTIRLHTQRETTAQASARFHFVAVPQMLASAHRIPADERHLAAGMMLLPTDLVPEAKERAGLLLSQIADLADSEQSAARQVYLLAIQLLPVTGPLD